MQPPKLPRPTPVPRVNSPLLSRLAADDVPDFWARIATDLPLVEETGTPGQVIVTFCWRDPGADTEAGAEEVLLFANRLTDETSLADTLLERLGDTDLWHASFAMASDWRASYGFLVRRRGQAAPWESDGHVALRAALDHALADPRNDQTCRNARGTILSVASLPDAPAQPWLAARPGVARAPITEYAGPDGRAISVHRQATHSPRVTDGSPLLVVLDGETWLDALDLPTTLDNLAADRATPPMTTLFVPSGGREHRWSELGSDAGARFLAGPLLDWATEQGLWGSGPVIVAGQSLGGLTALRAGLSRPDRIAGVLSCSASLWADDLAPLVAPSGVRIHLAHGTQEWVLSGPHADLASRLHSAGLEVEAVGYNGGHDYSWWRGAIADGLAWFFGSH